MTRSFTIPFVHFSEETTSKADHFSDTEVDLIGPPLPPGFDMDNSGGDRVSNVVKTTGLSSGSESSDNEDDSDFDVCN